MTQSNEGLGLYVRIPVGKNAKINYSSDNP